MRLSYSLLFILCMFYPTRSAGLATHNYEVDQLTVVIISTIIEQESKFCYDRMISYLIEPSLRGDIDKVNKIVMETNTLSTYQKESCLIHYYAILKRFR